MSGRRRPSVRRGRRAVRIGLHRTLIVLACIVPWPVFGQGGVHVVEPGDTLYELASRYDTTVTALRETNALVGDVLRVGTRLELPGPAGWSWRTVPNGVSWPELARDLELPETLLRDANPRLTRPGGAEVRVPPGDGPLATPRDGEDLIAFAARLGVPPGTLALRNGLEPPYPVEAGVPLLVPIADRAPEGLGGAVDASLDASIGSPIDSSIAPATVSHAELRIPALASLAEILERRPLTPPDDDFAWPLAGAPRITSRFGWRNVSVGGNRYHVGLDLGAPTGTPVLAVLDGTVLRAGWLGAYGYAVYVGHADGFESRYAHLSTIAVEPGQRVSRGTALGRVGSTGASTGPHLHFEVRQAGRALDPLGVLPDRARGASTSR